MTTTKNITTNGSYNDFAMENNVWVIDENLDNVDIDDVSYSSYAETEEELRHGSDVYVVKNLNNSGVTITDWNQYRETRVDAPANSVTSWDGEKNVAVEGAYATADVIQYYVNAGPGKSGYKTLDGYTLTKNGIVDGENHPLTSYYFSDVDITLTFEQMKNSNFKYNDGAGPNFYDSEDTPLEGYHEYNPHEAITTTNYDLNTPDDTLYIQNVTGDFTVYFDVVSTEQKNLEDENSWGYNGIHNSMVITADSSEVDIHDWSAPEGSVVLNHFQVDAHPILPVNDGIIEKIRVGNVLIDQTSFATAITKIREWLDTNYEASGYDDIYYNTRQVLESDNAEAKAELKALYKTWVKTTDLGLTDKYSISELEFSRGGEDHENDLVISKVEDYLPGEEQQVIENYFADSKNTTVTTFNSESGIYEINEVVDLFDVTYNFNVGDGDTSITLGAGNRDVVLNFISDTREGVYSKYEILNEDVTIGSITIVRYTGTPDALGNIQSAGMITDKLTITDYLTNGKDKVTFVADAIVQKKIEGAKSYTVDNIENLVENITRPQDYNNPAVITFSQQTVTSDSENPFQGSWLSEKIYGKKNVDDLIYGNDGDDYIDGKTGNDTIYGGTGNDALYGDSGNDKIYGDAGDDSITGGAGNDTIYGGAGNDTINGGNGSDTIFAGEGDDRITANTYGANEINEIHLGTGNDYVLLGGHKTYTEAGANVYGDGGANTYDVKSKFGVFNIYDATSADTLKIGGFPDSTINGFEFTKNEDNLVIKYTENNKTQTTTIVKYFDTENTPNPITNLSVNTTIMADRYYDTHDWMLYINDEHSVINQEAYDALPTEQKAAYSPIETAEEIAYYDGEYTKARRSVGPQYFDFKLVRANDEYTLTSANEIVFAGQDAIINIPAGLGNDNIYINGTGETKATLKYDDMTGAPAPEYIKNENDLEIKYAGSITVIKNYFDSETAQPLTGVMFKRGGDEAFDLVTQFTGKDAGQIEVDYSESTEDVEIVVADTNNDIKGGSGDNTINAGTGDNTITIESATETSTNTINVKGKDADTETEASETVISVNNGTNTIMVEKGNTEITTGAGSDTVVAGDGVNTVNLGAGVDAVTLGDGNNTVQMSAAGASAEDGAQDKTINLGTGENTVKLNNLASGTTNEVNITGAAGKTQTVTLKGANAVGENPASTTTLTVENGAATVKAVSGNNNINTAGGADTIYTGQGKDVVNAGAGDDTIVVAKDSTKNTITGGAGADTFRFVSSNIDPSMLGTARRVDGATTTIEDADANDHIDLPVTWDKVRFDRGSSTSASGNTTLDDLIISYNDGSDHEIILTNFFTVGNPLNIINTTDAEPEHQIRRDATIITTLSNTESLEADSRYSEIFDVDENATATVSLVNKTKDAIALDVDMDDTTLTRYGATPNALKVTVGTKNLIISDFFSNGFDLNINGATTSATTPINVVLTGQTTLEGTKYTETVSGYGSISGLTSTDKLSYTATGENQLTLTRNYDGTNNDALVLSGNEAGDLTVTDFFTSNCDTLNGQALRANNDITVNLSNDADYAADSNLREVITGSGYVSGLGASDKIVNTNATLARTYSTETPANNNRLTITGDSGALVVKDFFSDNQCNSLNGESIKNNDNYPITVLLFGENTDYAAETYYNEIITGAGSVHGLRAADKVANAETTTRTYDGTHNNELAIGDITVTDFFAGNACDTFADGTKIKTARMTVNASVDYTASNTYKEDIVAGADITVTGMDKTNDTLTVGDVTAFNRNAGSNDLIIDAVKDVVVKDFFATEGDITINTTGSTAGMTLNVTLNPSAPYQGTGYAEVLTGSGSVYGLDDADKIGFATGETYTISRNTSDNTLTLRITDALENVRTINITDYFSEDGSGDVVITGIDDHRLGITATSDYAATGLNEDITIAATGINISNLSANDTLRLDGVNTFVLDGSVDDDGLILTGKDYKITVSDYFEATVPPAPDHHSFKLYSGAIDAENTNLVDLSDEELIAVNVSNFDAADYAFGSYDITGKDDTNNILAGSEHDDSITGGNSDDYIYGGNGGADDLYGGEGDDHIYASDKLSNYNTTGVEIYGGAGNDTIKGGAGADYLRGGSDDDTLTGNGGADVFVIESGNDTITDATSADTIRLTVADGKEGEFTGISFDKGTGDDVRNLIISYGDAWSLKLVNYFNADGTVAADHVNNFTLVSASGEASYTLEWLPSNTAGFFGEDSDAMYNVDKNSTDPDDAPVIVKGIRNWIDGQVVGTDGVTIIGKDKYDMLAGTGNDDIIKAGSNGGELYGDAGDDKLFGGEGVDYLRGDKGSDILMGYDDADRFVFASGDGSDVIMDATSEDTIQIVGRTVEQGFTGISFAKGNTELEQTATSLYMTYGEGDVVEIKGYFNADGSVAEDHVTKFLLAGKTYTLDWRQSNYDDSWAMYNVIDNRGAEDEISAVVGIRNWIDGGDGTQQIIGANANDMLAGNDGDDYISAEDVAKTVEIYGGAGDDMLTGGSGNDWIAGNEGDDIISGGAGDDYLFGGDWTGTADPNGEDIIFGGEGDDHIYGRGGDDKLHGEAGDDVIYGGAGADEIHGGDGKDTIYTGSGDDHVYGDAGDDTIVINGAGTKNIDGGDGNNTFQFTSTGGSAVINDAKAGDIIKFETFDFSKVNFTRGTGDAANDLIISNSVDDNTITIKGYFAQEAADRISQFCVGEETYTLEWHYSNVENASYMFNVIEGTDAPNVLNAVPGIRNWISGRGEADTITGADNVDMLAGNDGGDTIIATSPAEIYGAAGDDVISAVQGSFVAGGAGDDEIYLNRTELMAKIKISPRYDGEPAYISDMGQHYAVVEGEHFVSLGKNAALNKYLWQYKPEYLETPEGEKRYGWFAVDKTSFHVDAEGNVTSIDPDVFSGLVYEFTGFYKVTNGDTEHAVDVTKTFYENVPVATSDEDWSNVFDYLETFVNDAHASNTICFVDTDRSETQKAFGDDTIYGATADDVLKFSIDYGSTTQAGDPQFVGYKFSELEFDRVGDNLVISAGDNSATIVDFFSAENPVNKIKALNAAGDAQADYEILRDADIYVDLNQVDGTYVATDYREVFSGTGTVEGFKNDKDSVESASPVLARSNNSADLVIDGITIKNFDFDANKPFKIMNGNTSTQSIDYPINVTLTDNTEYQATGYKEIIGGVGSVNLAGEHPFALANDSIGVADLDGISYTRVDGGDLHVVKGDTDIAVKGFSFTGTTNFNITDGTDSISTELITIDVTLTGALEGAYVSASGYAERITTTGSSAIKFWPEGQYTGKDTLIFGQDANLSYSRNGDDLVIANGDVVTTVVDYYTSGDMSVTGQFYNADIKVGNLLPVALSSVEKVTDISNVSYFDSGAWDTNRSETVDLVTGLTSDAAIDTEKLALDTEGKVSINDNNKYAYTSSVGYGNKELDSYALGRAGGDTINGTAGNDWINGGDDADAVFGGAGTMGSHDMLAGGSGDDLIVAGALTTSETDGAVEVADGKYAVLSNGTAEIYGGEGDDILVGGNGNDYLWGEVGTNTLTGGAGNDTFDFTVKGTAETPVHDTITDACKDDTIAIFRKGIGEVTFTKSEDGKDLVITADANNTLTVKGYFDQAVADRVNQFKFGEETYTLGWHTSTVMKDGDVAHEGMYLEQLPGGDTDAVEGIPNWINTGEGDDTIYGANKYDMLAGNTGDDTIIASDYSSELYGGEGDDILKGGAGNDYLWGEVGTNELTGGAGNDTFDFTVKGTAETPVHDTITDACKDDTIAIFRKGIGEVTFTKSEDGKDLVITADANNTLTVKGYFDQAVADRVNQFQVDGTIYTLGWHTSSIILNGEAAKHEGMYLEQLPGGSVEAVEGIPNWINTGEGNDLIYGANKYDMLAGNTGNDTIIASDYSSELYGDAGDDVLVGGDGNDYLWAGTAGEQGDVVTGGAGADKFDFTIEGNPEVAPVNTTITDASVDDTIAIFRKGFADLKFEKSANGEDLIISSGDYNTLTVKGFFVGTKFDDDMRLVKEDGTHLVEKFQVNGTIYTLGWHKSNVFEVAKDVPYEGMYLEQTDVEDPTVIEGIPNWINGGEFVNHITGMNQYDMLAGNDGDDIITASNKDTEIYGGAGVDTLTGKDGNDWIEGNEGNDIINGGAGNDYLFGGSHDSSLEGSGDDEIHGGSGADYISGGDGADNLYGGEGADSIYGGAGNDYIEGGEGSDLIAGNAGDDTLKGGEGNDKIYTGAGTDTVYGDADNDTIYVNGGGTKILNGGADIDTFVFSNTTGVVDATIVDAVAGESIEFPNYDFSDLKFTRGLTDGVPNNTLYIEYGDEEVGGKITLENYFNSATPVDKIVTKDCGEQKPSYSVLADALINVTVVNDYTGNAYNENIDASGATSHVTIHGEDGDDVITGSKFDDVLYGDGGINIIDGGEGNDTIYVDEGDDIVVFKGDFGTDTIKGAKSAILTSDGDSLLFPEQTFDELTFVKNGRHLEITVNDNKKARLENYFEENGSVPATAVKTITTADGEHNILDAEIVINLTGGEYEANTWYKQLIQGTGTITNTVDNDKVRIAVKGAPEYSRVNEGGLIIEGATSGRIAVSDFIFDGTHNIKVNGTTTAGMTVNVLLTAAFANDTYTGTPYAEVFSVENNVTGNVQNLKAADSIAVSNATLSRAWDGTKNDELKITNGTSTFIVKDYFTYNQYPCYRLADSTITSHELNVTLTEAGGLYTADADFAENISGDGSVQGMNLENDKIVVTNLLGGHTLFQRTNNGYLVVKGQTEGKITVTDFVADGEHDIKVNSGSTAGMTVDVTLDSSLGDDTYKSWAAYAERITTLVDSSIEFSTEFDPAATDTLVFDEAVGMSYRREGQDLVITAKYNNNEYVNTTVLGFYSDNTMAITGQFGTIGVDFGDVKQTLGDLEVTDISEVSDFIGTDKDESIQGKLAVPNTLKGEGGNDYIEGGNLGDTIYGGEGNDEIYGYAGGDVIYTGAGSDIVNAGEGDDLIEIDARGTSIDPETGEEVPDSNTIVFEGNFGNDKIYGSNEFDVLDFRGYTIDDIIDGLSKVQYTEGDLEVVDLVITLKNVVGEETVKNTVTLKNYTKDSLTLLNIDGEPVEIKLQDLVPVVRTFEIDKKHKTITGTEHGDLIDVENNTQIAEAGLVGKSKTIYGKEGVDEIIAGVGNDTINAGGGKNTIYFSEGDGSDTILNGGGTDHLVIRDFDLEDLSTIVMSESKKSLVISYGHKGDKITIKDYLNGSSTQSVKDLVVLNEEGDVIKTYNLYDSVKPSDPENPPKPVIEIDAAAVNKTNITGSTASETIIGSSKNNTLKGGGGNDVIDSFSGKNKVYADSRSFDSVTVYSGTGVDTITTGVGTDTLVFSDGSGNDTVVLNKKATVDTKTILDFSKATSLSFKESGKNLIITNTFVREESGVVVSETTTIKNYLKGGLAKDIVYIYEPGNDKSAAPQTLYTYLTSEQAADPKTLVVGNPYSKKKQKVNGTFLDETVTGGLGNDTVKSGSGVDIINGGDGNDKLYGYVATTKEGKKTVYHYTDETVGELVYHYGTDNAKTFLFDSHDGKDKIYNAKHDDSIKIALDPIVTDDEVSYDVPTYAKSGNNLVINYGYGLDKNGKPVTTDSITIVNFYKLSADQVMKDVYFYDSETDALIDHVDLTKDVAMSYSGKGKIYDTAYNDDITGSKKNDKYYITKGGNDVLTDPKGNDTYTLSKASGFTEINDKAGKDTMVVSNLTTDQIIFGLNFNKDGSTICDGELFVINSESPIDGRFVAGVDNYFALNGDKTDVSGIDAGYIETIKASNGTINMMNNSPNGADWKPAGFDETLAQAVAGWLTNETAGRDYACVADAIAANDANLAELAQIYAAYHV